MNSIYLSSNICIPFIPFQFFLLLSAFSLWPDIHVSGRAALLDLRRYKNLPPRNRVKEHRCGGQLVRGPKHRCFQGLKGASPHLPPIYPPLRGSCWSLIWKIAGCASILVVPISHSLVWVIGILWCWFCTQGSHADLCRFLDWTWGSSSTRGSPKPAVSISWFFGRN